VKLTAQLRCINPLVANSVGGMFRLHTSGADDWCVGKFFDKRRYLEIGIRGEYTEGCAQYLTS
jgi:hypothetical protein